jgi:hypothetical protein
MTTNELVIWQSFIMRRDRDLERLWQRNLEGDPISGKFFDGLGEWLEKCRKAPDKTPQCLTCERAFCNPVQPPLTYLVTYSEDPRTNPSGLVYADVLILTGVCWRCAKMSDAELLKHGGELTAKFMKGRVLGHAHLPATGAH